MAINWEAGDWAQCIYDGPWGRVIDGEVEVITGPRYLQVLQVTGVMRNDECQDCHTGLFLHGFPCSHPTDAFDSCVFRKIAGREGELEIRRSVVMEPEHA